MDPKKNVKTAKRTFELFFETKIRTELMILKIATTGINENSICHEFSFVLSCFLKRNTKKMIENNNSNKEMTKPVILNPFHFLLVFKKPLIYSKFLPKIYLKFQ